MSGVAPLVPAVDRFAARPSPPRSPIAGEFQAMLDDPATDDPPAVPSRAIEFGADGVFAPRRPAGDASSAAARPAEAPAVGAEQKEAVDRLPAPVCDPPHGALAAQLALAPPGRPAGEVSPPPAPESRASAVIGSQPVSPSHAVALPPQPAAPARLQEEASRSPDRTRAAGSPPRIADAQPGGEPQPVALAVSVADGAARILVRADALPASAATRISRILQDHGLALARLRLNGRDLATDHPQPEGGFHGRSSR